MQKAASLGRRAVLLGLETLDLAKIHEHALVAIGVPNALRGKSLTKKGSTFFLSRRILNATLHQWTKELTVLKRAVKKNILQRPAAEESLKTRNEDYKKLLNESRAMDQQLRCFARRVLSEQENERGQVSRELDEEIVQVLVGINVRLLALQREGSWDSRRLLIDIARTQRLLERSIKSIQTAIAS